MKILSLDSVSFTFEWRFVHLHFAGLKSIWTQILRKVSVHDIFEIEIQFTR